MPNNGLDKKKDLKNRLLLESGVGVSPWLRVGTEGEFVLFRQDDDGAKVLNICSTESSSLERETKVEIFKLRGGKVPQEMGSAGFKSDSI